MRNFRFLLVAVGIVAVLGGVALRQVEAAEGGRYSDVRAENPYFKAIMNLSEKGVLEGYPDGEFKPEQPINRVEALKVILKAFEKEEIGRNATEKRFPDVPEEEWFFGFVEQGVRHGIVEGYVDGEFKPGNQVLFSESLKMALVASHFEVNGSEEAGKEFHPSVTSDDWFYKYFNYGYQKNFFGLESHGGLNPNRPFARGEFVELIYKIMNTKRGEVFDISYNWVEENNEKGINIVRPNDWEYFTLGEGLFLGYFAGQNPTFMKNVDNGARISINFWKNVDGLSVNDYFAKIKNKVAMDYNSLDIKINENKTEIGPAMSVLIKEIGLFENYIYLNKDTVLVAEGSFDESSLKADELVKEIDKIYENLKYNQNLVLDANSKLEMARKGVMIEKRGQEILDLFIGKELIFTDSLGVGTGPVDYYFIKGINHTIKYERSFDVILDIQEGNTSSF